MGGEQLAKRCELPGRQAVRVGVRYEGRGVARLGFGPEEEVPLRERMQIPAGPLRDCLPPHGHAGARPGGM